MLFPVGNSHFGRPQNKFQWFLKVKSKEIIIVMIIIKMIKMIIIIIKVLSSLCKFSSFPPSIFNFHLPSFDFPSFLLLFFFFFFVLLASLFPGRSAEISRSEVLGAIYPLPPPCCYATDFVSKREINMFDRCKINLALATSLKLFLVSDEPRCHYGLKHLYHVLTLVLLRVFPKHIFLRGGGVVATPLWIINTEGHITLNLLPVYRYGHPLSIDTKISTNH